MKKIILVVLTVISVTAYSQLQMGTNPAQNQATYLIDNVLITPHIGGSTEEAILAMGLAAIEGLKNPLDPLNLI